MRCCPFCKGEIDESHEFLAHLVACQRRESERWTREFDASLRRRRDLVVSPRPEGR